MVTHDTSASLPKRALSATPEFPWDSGHFDIEGESLAKHAELEARRERLARV
jgi:hypothetical protein